METDVDNKFPMALLSFHNYLWEEAVLRRIREWKIPVNWKVIEDTSLKKGINIFYKKNHI